MIATVAYVLLVAAAYYLGRLEERRRHRRHQAAGIIIRPGGPTRAELERRRPTNEAGYTAPARPRNWPR